MSKRLRHHVFILPRIIGLCALFFAIIYPLDAIARDEKIRSLDDSNVRAFITKTSHVTTKRDELMPVNKVRSYLKKHLAENVRFASKMTYFMPGMPEQETTVILTKDEFIDTAGQGAESIQGYDNRVEIQEIKISYWGKKAFVKTINTENGFMSVPNPDGSGHGDDVAIEGKSECTQSLILTKGVIQISNAVCETNIHFKE